jgi:protein phosphatase 1G
MVRLVRERWLPENLRAPAGWERDSKLYCVLCIIQMSIQGELNGYIHACLVWQSLSEFSSYNVIFHFMGACWTEVYGLLCTYGSDCIMIYFWNNLLNFLLSSRFYPYLTCSLSGTFGRMGVYLSTPKTEKLSEDGENDKLKFGLSSMQGWRATMEDAVSFYLSRTAAHCDFSCCDAWSCESYLDCLSIVLMETCRML